jgi:hypothetical protein
MPGSIIRVALKNFVTYTSAEFFPGPNMNLVIGPNGSGKSTIVCAICLGLGYSPNVLGRATAVGDFVQHGKDSAEIEVELSLTATTSMIIRRKIKKDKNSSAFHLDGISDFDWLMVGKPATLSNVQEQMKAFNIQIDNLWYVDLGCSDVVNSSRKIVSLRLPNFRQLNFCMKLNVPSVENRWWLTGNDSVVSVLKHVNSKLFPSSYVLIVGRQKRYRSIDKFESKTSCCTGPS